MRIDEVTPRRSRPTPRSTYSLLLDDAVVLDHLPGAAVQVDGQWLVTRRTYCDVSTQGPTEIPPPCQ